MSESSPKDFKDAVTDQLKRSFQLSEFPGKNVDATREWELTIGETLAKKQEAGFTLGAVIHAPFAPFFLSELTEMSEARAQLIEEQGGADKIEFYQIKRTKEIIALIKN